MEGVQELRSFERSTLEVSFEDIEKYNQSLATTIIEEYYRYVLKFICLRSLIFDARELELFCHVKLLFSYKLVLFY